MTDSRSLAVAQTVPVRGDVGANVKDHVRFVRAAAKEGARVLVFPELSLTGYELELAAEFAFGERDSRLDPLRDAAQASGVTVVAGAPVRLEEKLHIAAFLLGADGEIDVYTKHHLGAVDPSANPGGSIPPAEATVFVTGDRSPLVRGAGPDAAVAICADTGRASHAAAAAGRGARSYLAGVFIVPDEIEAIAVRLGSRAERHRMAVAMANYGGPTGGLPSAGRSAIWSDTGELLVRLEPVGRGLATAVESAEGWRCRATAFDGLDA